MITISEVKQTVLDALDERSIRKPPLRQIKKKPEFSKKLIIFVSAIFATTWGVALYSWFVGREIPWQLVEIVNWLFGAVAVSYCCKSAYENKFKIENGEWHE